MGNEQGLRGAVDLGQFYAGRPVLITGGLGFIGSNLAHRLVAYGAEIVLVDSLIPGYGGNPANIAGIEDRLRVASVDLRDGAAMRALIPDCSVIFNLAAQSGHVESMRFPAVDLAINTTAQLDLLEACRECNPGVTVIYASTRQIYGRPDYLPVNEDHPLRPVDVNGINKIAGESYHLLYHRVYGLKTAALRLTNTYGPRMRIADARQTFLGIWLRRVLEGQKFEVWGGAQLRDLAYVDDVVTAFLRLAACPDALGQAYNIGGAPPIRLDDLARTLIDAAGGGGFDHRDFPADRKQIDIGNYYADDQRFRAATGWAPETGLRQGLMDSLAYYRRHLADYLAV